jgi:hypothetical protein
MKKLAVISSLLISAAMPQIHAQTGCFNGNLQGNYSFVASGTVVNVPGFPQGPFAAVGKTTTTGMEMLPA